MPTRIRVYGSPHSPKVTPVREMLLRAKAPFEYIDISRDMAGRAALHRITHGYDSVPTIVFPDGLSLVEPTPDQMKRNLLRFGYSVGSVVGTRKVLALASSPFTAFLGVMGVAIGIATGITWVWLLGVVLVLVMASAVVAIRLAD